MTAPAAVPQSDLDRYAELAAGVHQYAEDAAAGRIVVNRYVRLAAQRHLDDMAHGHRRGLSFDPAAAGKPLAFFPMLRLAEGNVADEGRPFTLMPWQVFNVGSLFGWMRQDEEDGVLVRRFRNAYTETGKGSGKTPMGAGAGVFALAADVESAPEVYSAAPSRDQSKIPWTDAKRMVEASPALRSRIDISAFALSAPRRNGTFQYLSSEAKNLHGHRPHMVLIEEEHAHPDSDVIDAMRLGTKGRRNALIWRITNSGRSRHSVCWADHEYSVRILERELADDAWFAFVCGLDMCDEHRKLGRPEDGCPRCDQWTDESVWPKANPSIGVSITKRYLREAVTEAVGKPSAQSVVKRLNFCIWDEAANAWLDAGRFRELGPAGDGLRPLPMPEGARGSGGLDLSSTTDITSAAFKSDRVECPDEGHAGRCYDLRVLCWVPEDRVAEKEREDKVPYGQWVRDGWIRATRGNRVDQEQLLRDIEPMAGSFATMGIDRWNTAWLTPKLQDAGFTVVEVGQGFASLSAPSKRLEADIAEGVVHHDGNPVLLWMVGNAVAEQDAAGNIKPSKAKSADRIDGVAAWVDALFASMVEAEAAKPSVYDRLTPEELAERMLL
jgi:phage terminase large subunit-like protein